MRANLVLADGDLKDVEQACHNSPLLVLALLVAVVRIRRARTRRHRLLCQGSESLLIGFGRAITRISEMRWPRIDCTLNLYPATSNTSPMSGTESQSSKIQPAMVS